MSSTKLNPCMLGSTVEMAGRLMPGMRPMRPLLASAAANTPPELPAETSASTWPSRNRPMATTIDASALERAAWLGCSPMAIPIVFGQFGRDGVLVAHQHDLVAKTPRSAHATLDIRLWKAVAAHGIQGDSHGCPLGVGRSCNVYRIVQDMQRS